MRLSLKYGLVTTPDYLERYQTYVNATLQDVAKKMNVYHMHEALDILDEGLVNLPQCPEFLVARSKVFWQTGISQANAMSDVDKAILMNPKHPESWLWRGIMKYSKGDFFGSWEDFQKCSENCPQTKEALMYKALAGIRLKKKDEVVKDVEKMQKQFPQEISPELCYFLRSIATEKTFNTTPEQFEKLNKFLSTCDPWFVENFKVFIIRQKIGTSAENFCIHRAIRKVEQIFEHMRSMVCRKFQSFYSKLGKKLAPVRRIFVSTDLTFGRKCLPIFLLTYCLSDGIIYSISS